MGSQWLENQHWQYYCGNEYFEQGFPIVASLCHDGIKEYDAGAEMLLEGANKAGLI
ncbi:MAG: hypothetical protein GY777_18155 [Candidatus Brocadiaceae bacterium]|nr:hypothetical protein [Candidatus Brocadiaceae bacterium]